MDDFSIFRSIEAAEFVDKVFGLISSASSAPDGGGCSSNNENVDSLGGGGFATGCANLDTFTDLVNKEAYWVPSELCAETSLPKRVDILKRFIKVSKSAFISSRIRGRALHHYAVTNSNNSGNNNHAAAGVLVGRYFLAVL